MQNFLTVASRKSALLKGDWTAQCYGNHDPDASWRVAKEGDFGQPNLKPNKEFPGCPGEVAEPVT